MEQEDEFGDIYADLGPETGENHGIGSVGFEELDSDEEYEEILFGRTPHSQSETAIVPLESLNNLSLDREESEEDEELSLFGRSDDKGVGGVPSGADKFIQRPENDGSVTPPKENHCEFKVITGERFEAASVEVADLQKFSRLAENGAVSFQPIAEDAITRVTSVGDLREDFQSSLPQSSALTKLVLQKQASPDLDDFTHRTAAIPGLSTSPIVRRFDVDVDEDDMGEGWEGKGHLAVQDDVLTGGAAADWDSDSEDDLQIVLNEESLYPNFEKVADKNFEASEEEDEEDLVIVAGGESLEDQEWGEEQPQAPDGVQPIAGDNSLPVGDRQLGTAEDRGLPGKTGSSMGTNQGFTRMGYGGHAYHHHSQYKYVRPSSTTVSGVVATTAAQVASNRITLGKAGSGRGDWSGAGRGLYGPQRIPQIPPWGSGASRGFQYGYEFTLPPAKTVFDIDIDSLEEKPWRHPGVDMTDFFNFGFNETSWKDYCKQLAQMRLEATMQSKIRVYESGRPEQEYDPDLPPELAAAAGLHEASGESTQPRQSEVDATTAAGRGGHTEAIPTGRAIQVEGGLGERRPSSDTRGRRFRDCDAILLHEAEEEEPVKVQDEDDDARLVEEEGEEEEDEVEGEEKIEPEIDPKQQKDPLHESQIPSGARLNISKKAGVLPSVVLQAADVNECAYEGNKGATPFSMEPEMQVVDAESIPGESSSAATDRNEVPRSLSPIEGSELNRLLEADDSHSSIAHGESEYTGEMKKNDGYERIDTNSIERTSSPEAAPYGRSAMGQNLTEASVHQELDEHEKPSSRDGLIRDGTTDVLHHSKYISTAKKQRLSSRDDSHTASPPKSAKKKHLEHSGELSKEMLEDDREGLDSIQHKRQHMICREDELLDDEEDAHSQKRRSTFWTSAHQAESETVMQTENSDEHIRRMKEVTKDKGRLAEHSADRDDSLGNAYIRRKEREDDAKRRNASGKEEGSKYRERGRHLDFPVSRRKRDEEGRKRERLDREEDLRHRDGDDKLTRRHNNEDKLPFRRNTEEESRRRERSEKDGIGREQRGRNIHGSERRATREKDPYIKRREEDIWRRDRVEEYRQRRGREETWREREDAHHRKGIHQDVHGRREKDDERSVQVGRIRRQIEEKAGHANDNHVRESVRVASSDRDRTREKPKREGEQVKDRDRPERFRESEGKPRPRDSVIEEERARNEGKNLREKSSGSRTIEEQRLQSDRRKSDIVRNKESKFERNGSASVFTEERNHHSSVDIGRKRKADNQSGRAKKHQHANSL